MGLTYVEGVLTGPTGKTATLRFLVDSGTTYTLVLHDVWTSLDLAPKRVLTFTVADGPQVWRADSECHLSLPQGDGTRRMASWARRFPKTRLKPQCS